MSAESLRIFPEFSTILARTAAAALSLAILFALTIVATSAQAQTYKVIHSFTDGADGANPQSGLAIDAAGSLYGTTVAGGTGHLCSAPPGCGTIFRLTHAGSDWVTTPIYEFYGTSDGGHPISPVAFAPDGTLYGTTYPGYGTLFRLTPPPTPPASTFGTWDMTVLHSFDGANPLGELVFDADGNVYGTTAFGGPYNYGTVYEWTGLNLVLIYSGQSYPDGQTPEGGVTLDSSGNLYGTFSAGGPYQSGMAFELSPSHQGWSIQNLAVFSGGYAPVSGLIFDPRGNLYGRRVGSIFELVHLNGYWNLTGVYDVGSNGPDRLVIDSAGNFYGTAYDNGDYGMGSVFRLTPSNGGWIYTSLHDFCPAPPGCSDGAQPLGSVVFDANGNLYGTASSGGAYGYGVVWEITP